MISKYSLGLLFKLIKLFNSITNSKKNCVTIITYHAIEENYENAFKSQIEWLKKNYKILNPKEFYDFLDGKKDIDQHSVVITFDDGFISSYNAIQNFLNPLDIKVFFFIPSMFVNFPKNKWEQIISNNFFSGKLDLKNFPNCYQPISVEKIKNLINQGHKIGGHTNSHRNISGINSEQELNKEIIDPINIYKSKLNINLDSFAFPYGRIDHINYKSLKKISLNYSYCFSNIRGTNSHKTSNFAIRRQHVSPDMPIRYFGYIIEGGLDFYWNNHAKKLNDLANNLNN